MPRPLTVKAQRWGPDGPTLARATKRLLAHTIVRQYLEGTNHRLLSTSLLEPARKPRKPPSPTRFRATVYDYTNERTLLIDGDVKDREYFAIAESAVQPLSGPEEFEAAVKVLEDEPELGPALRSGAVQPYPPMPPLLHTELPEGNLERNVTVGLLPQGNGARHEIVSVNLNRGEVARFDEGAPLTSRAAAGICGVPVAAGQATAAQGTPGQAWVTVSQGGKVIWRFLVVRPAASSGNDGSGVELRYLDYRGRRVLYQAHVPILNVLYDRNTCGPYRDWQYQEGKIQASGTDVAPGFRLCPNPAKTIMESGSDTGNFLGVGIYVQGQEVVLVSELEAGWYRYVSEWRLHADGTIRPRFGFAATSSSCVCAVHHHHVYWRLDFDIGTPGRNRVREFNNPPVAPGGGNWHQNRFEGKRFRAPARKRRWRVENASGRGYTILPGPRDRTAAGDPYAKGDLWILRYRPGEIDDYPIIGTEAQLDKLVNHESVADEDVVIWYGAHFTHDVGHHTSVPHIVGPDLVPHNW
ncbi:MAG: hypothetical protein ACRDQ2_04335 [Gaiellales bacterium]